MVYMNEKKIRKIVSEALNIFSQRGYPRKLDVFGVMELTDRIKTKVLKDKSANVYILKATYSVVTRSMYLVLEIGNMLLKIDADDRFIIVTKYQLKEVKTIRVR